MTYTFSGYATIPTTDDPLMTGTAEQAFYDGDHATVGPFTDLTVPANPFTITPTQADVVGLAV